MAFVVALVTWAGNVALVYASARFHIPVPGSPTCMHSPMALGVFCVSFLVVFVALLVISAQPAILRFVLFLLHSTSPFSRRAMTRDWQRRFVSWYKSRRAARVCVWIKNDDVRCEVCFLCTFLCFLFLI
jgi:hypothetical protein